MAGLSMSACTSTHQKGKPAISQAEANRAALAHALAEADRASANGLKTEADQMAYNLAVEKAVEKWLSLTDEKSRATNLDLQGVDNSYRLKASWPKELSFDKLILASTIKSRELKKRYKRDGVGAPFVAHWEYTDERKVTEPFMTKGGYFSSVTATLEVQSAGSGKRSASLVLHDPRPTTTVRLGGASHPLAADLSAMGEYMLAMKAGTMSAIGALMHSSKNLDKLGIIALDRPSKDRIPVILVHGLASRPRTWQNVFNELSADPELAKHYQLYFFRYPSGVPVVFSATKFREHLKTLHDQLEKQGSDKLAHHMVLIGHSMGGLVSKMQVQKSGDRLWVNIFGDKPEKLGLSKDDMASLSEYLEFNPNPYVDRIIFVSTPHRGSPLGQGGIGAFGRSLISLPTNILGNAFNILKGEARQNPRIRDFLAKGIPSSIENLSPTSRFVQTSMSLPLNKDVHFHSIVGNKDMLPLTDPKCSDGVVPYTSAHLDFVESELVVHSNHSSHEHQEAIEEMRRILLLHFKKL
jgi:hypothetical protein